MIVEPEYQLNVNSSSPLNNLLDRLCFYQPLSLEKVLDKYSYIYNNPGVEFFNLYVLVKPQCTWTSTPHTQINVNKGYLRCEVADTHHQILESGKSILIRPRYQYKDRVELKRSYFNLFPSEYGFYWVFYLVSGSEIKFTR